MTSIRIIIITNFLITIIQFASADFQRLHVKDGALFFENGEEAVFWGVNLQPSLSWEYNRMKRHGLHSPLNLKSYKKMIDEAFSELQMLGCNLIRIHLSPGDITDKNGNLVENHWLDLTDYVLAEAEKRNMYTYLALLNSLGRDRGENTFIPKNKHSKPLWMIDPDFIVKSDLYIRQLLNRKNKYANGVKYKDSPALAFVEPINEPDYFTRETIASSHRCKKIYIDWLSNKEKVDSDEAFSEWRMHTTKSYINKMVKLFKEEKVSAPMVWSMEWPRMMEWTGPDVFVAAAESDVEVLSVCLYPGQSVAYGKKSNDLKDVGEKNYFEYIQNCYDLPEWHGWMREKRFLNKARIVYEFETYYNHSSYLYPLMAKYFRAQGIQAAAMWTYLLPGQAEYTAASHHLNLKTTPNKAASFLIAGEIMRNLSRYEPFVTTTEYSDYSEHFALSYRIGSSAYADEKKLIYSESLPPEFIENLKYDKSSLSRVIGKGHSPLASYDGSGLYFINRMNSKSVEITILPDATFIAPFYLTNKRKEKVVSIKDDVEHLFRIDLPKTSKLTSVYRLENGKRQKVRNHFDDDLYFKARAGSYIINH